MKIEKKNQAKQFLSLNRKKERKKKNLRSFIWGLINFKFGTNLQGSNRLRG